MRCFSPYKKETGESFPCGKCYNCLQRRVAGWSFRLQQEEKGAASAFFITLTYDIEHVPITENKWMTLNKADIQKWLKRLRKAHYKYATEGYKDLKLKYYLCGEYGTKSDRPHYHVILFNADLAVMLDKKLARQVELGNLELDGQSPMQIESWTQGHVTIGRVETGSILYTLKYMSKPSRIPKHNQDDRSKEFANMSKGLGKSYLSEEMIKWHREDALERAYIPIGNDIKIAIPRYYRESIFEPWHREAIQAHLQLKEVEWQKNSTPDQRKKKREEEYQSMMVRMKKHEKDQRNNKI